MVKSCVTIYPPDCYIFQINDIIYPKFVNKTFVVFSTLFGNVILQIGQLNGSQEWKQTLTIFS